MPQPDPNLSNEEAPINPDLPALARATEDAIKLFESHPDFPRVQVRMRELMEEATRNSLRDARDYGSKARMEYVLSLFDMRAEAFLELVSDIHTQNAFMVVLASLERAAWEEYTGWPVEVMRPESAEAQADLYRIHVKVQRRTYDGYKRLESHRNAQRESVDNASPTADKAAPAPPASVANSNSRGRKRGPKPDHETASRVAQIVARVAPDGDSRSNVVDICEALDEEKIPIPRAWRRKRECRYWSDCLERAIVIKAIEYRLKVAHQRKRTTPETFS